MKLGQKVQRAPSWLRFAVKTRSGGYRSREPVKRRVSPLTALGATALLAVFAGVMWWWYAAYTRLATLREPITHLASVAVTVPAGGIVIGSVELGQPDGPDSAELQHLEFFMAPVAGAQAGPRQMGVFVRNRAAHKRALVRLTRDRSAYLEWWWLRPDGEHVITLPGATFQFSNIGTDGFDIAVRETGRSARSYNLVVGALGVEMKRTDAGAPAARLICDPFNFRTFRSSIGFAAQKYLPALADGELRIVDLVGKHTCFDPVTPQIGAELAVVGREPWKDMTVLRRDGRFYLVAGDSGRRNRLAATFSFRPKARPPVPDVTAEAKGFSGQDSIAWRLDGPDGITRVTAGRTRYTVQVARERAEAIVTLTPIEKVPLFDTKGCREERADARCPKPVERAEIKQQWRLEPHILARTGARVLDPREATRAETWLSTREAQLRIVIALGAIGMVLLSTGARARLVAFLLRRRYADSAPVLMASDASPSFAVVATSAAALLVLTPDLSVLVGRPLSAEWTFRLTLAAWGLVGIVMLRSGAPIALLTLWTGFTVLAAIGTITLMTMAIDGNTTNWAVYGVKHLYLFVALVPPIVIAAATVPLGAVRTVLSESLVGVRPGYRWVRWLAVALLVIPFAAWMVAGSQQGISGFQPVEAGKFAAAVIIATLFAGLSAATRRTAVDRGIGAKVISFILLCGLLGLLMAVPVFRNDYSPALIVGLLVGSLFGAWLLPTSILAARDAIARRVAYRRIPLAFWPRRARRWIVVVITGGILAVPIGLILLFFSPVTPVAITWALDIPGWPSERKERIDVLQKGLGFGRRVPVERFLAYEDLHLDNVKDLPPGCAREPGASPKAQPTTAVANSECPRARFRDIEFQLIRARAAVGHAPCTLTGPLASGFETLPARVRSVYETPVKFLDQLVIGKVRESLCPPVFEVPATTETPDGKPAPRTGLLDARPPIGIPVVQNDFAAAFLIARFGVGAGFLFALAQAAVVILGLVTFVRLLLKRTGGWPGDVGVRTFLLITTAGAILLFILHWAISWSNVLGLLPLMGQPMTWLSAATSHHLLMVLPCLVIMVLSTRYINFTPVHILWRAPPRT